MVDDVKLYNGVLIPKIGFGTFGITGNNAIEIFANAIKVGYRHFDTAQKYNNEFELSVAIKSSGIKRENFFIASKISYDIFDYNEALNSIDASLKNLATDYIDLMLVHAPFPWNKNTCCLSTLQGNYGIWRSLEEAYLDGKVRAIGISNFNIMDIANLFDYATVMPMVNQILLYPGHTEHKLIKCNVKNNIAIEAYSPFNKGKVFNNPVINRLSVKYCISPAELCLAYLIQLGAIVLPHSKLFTHMKVNLTEPLKIAHEDFEILKNM